MSNAIAARNVGLKRAYNPPAAEDGVRILVDRLWPRGVAKGEAAIDRWPRCIAPSAELRRWFGHDPDRWREFARRYATEIRGNPDALEDLRRLARNGRITLVYSARDELHNDAVVLRKMILGRMAG